MGFSFDVREALRGVVYHVPGATGVDEWQTADRYLSGQVAAKLREARAAAALDHQYTENVTALEAVQPQPVDKTLIAATLGAPWIPVDVVLDFAYTLFPGHTWGLTITYTEVTTAWHIECINTAIQRSEENCTILGAPRMRALELLDAALNLQIPVIYDEFERADGSTYRVKNDQETAAAQGKLIELRDRWAQWVWSDETRAKELTTIYNERFNGTRARAFNGAHLTFPGMAAEVNGVPFSLRKHQRDGAARILTDGGEDRGTLLAWEVGRGKTAAAIAAAVKRIQLGLSHRALFVVPKHVLVQWRTAFASLYPGLVDEVAAATDEAFGPTKRKRFLASIAAGDYRYAIVTYEQFKSIPVSEAAFRESAEREVADLRAHLDAAQEGSDEQKILKRAFKQREKTLLRFATRYEEAWKRVGQGDAPITWEEMGIDMLIVDEVHNFTRDLINTKMQNVAGLPRAESHRAFDLRLKAHGLMTRRGRFVGLTGTPITNTLAEAWIMMRLFQPNTLRRLGLQHFDAWAATFAEPYSSVEMDSVGKFRTQTRLRFQNIPELMTLLGEAWDRIGDDNA